MEKNEVQCFCFFFQTLKIIVHPLLVSMVELVGINVIVFCVYVLRQGKLCMEEKLVKSVSRC